MKKHYLYKHKIDSHYNVKSFVFFVCLLVLIKTNQYSLLKLLLKKSAWDSKKDSKKELTIPAGNIIQPVKTTGNSVFLPL